jgi:hypothetical protein
LRGSRQAKAQQDGCTDCPELHALSPSAPMSECDRFRKNYS